MCRCPLQGPAEERARGGKQEPGARSGSDREAAAEKAAVTPLRTAPDDAGPALSSATCSGKRTGIKSESVPPSVGEGPGGTPKRVDARIP